jgi:hypothetical protein
MAARRGVEWVQTGAATLAERELLLWEMLMAKASGRQ